MPQTVSVDVSESANRVQRLIREGVPRAVIVAQGDALQASARVVLNAARETTRFKDKTGNLRGSMDVRRIPFQRNVNGREVSSSYAQIYFRRPKGAHVHLVEFGHRIVRKGRVFGRVEGRRFLHHAVEETDDARIDAFSQAFRPAYEREIRKVDLF